MLTVEKTVMKVVVGVEHTQHFADPPILWGMKTQKPLSLLLQFLLLLLLLLSLFL
jgi:hypothetical protein